MAQIYLSKLCVNWYILYLLCANNVYCVEYLTEKPSYMEQCKIYEPNFTACSTRSVQKLLNEVIKGIPEIHEKIGPLEPLHLSHILFKQDNNEAATIQANLTNLSLIGFSKIQVKESRVSKKDFSWNTKVYVPKLRIEGNYEMEGKILLLPLSGNGEFFIELDDLNMNMLTKTRLYEKGGFTFYNVTNVHVNLMLSGVRSYYKNLFNGKSPEVEASTNKFFNDNWPDFFEALRPLITETVEKVMLSTLQTTFHFMPAKFLVEDIPTSEQLYVCATGSHAATTRYCDGRRHHVRAHYKTYNLRSYVNELAERFRPAKSIKGRRRTGQNSDYQACSANVKNLRNADNFKSVHFSSLVKKFNKHKSADRAAIITESSIFPSPSKFKNMNRSMYIYIKDLTSIIITTERDQLIVFHSPANNLVFALQGEHTPLCIICKKYHT